MKTIFYSLLLTSALAISCSETIVGPEGPKGDPGPVGPEGAPGESGYVFEYENIDFTGGNDYQVFLEYPEDFEGLNSDVALVYFLWGVDENEGDIWRPLPQQVLFTDGTLQYNYDFTSASVRLFLEANFSLSELTEIDTDGWIARVVIVPGSFWNSGRRTVPTYHELETELGLPELTSLRNRVYMRK